jgi:hypothetical protein
MITFIFKYVIQFKYKPDFFFLMCRDSCVKQNHFTGS